MCHPSRYVLSFNLTKSRVNLNSPGVGLGTMCTWLHSLAVECLMTPNSSSLSHCCLIWDCFSTECVRGGSLCLIDMGGISAGISKISEYSSHRALNFRCSIYFDQVNHRRACDGKLWLVFKWVLLPFNFIIVINWLYDVASMFNRC